LNFTEFSFWWLLFLFIVPLLSVRYVGKRLKLWQDDYDRIGLMLLSLILFYNASSKSFIAVGIAKAMGVELTINFLAPYTALSIQEFWRWWHITLNNWFRDYVFLPLMGTKKQWAAFYLFITFTLSGFWHGASWNFVL